MYRVLISLLDILDSEIIDGLDIIKWGAPVPSFGDITKSKVATIGLNPSNKEFVDDFGNELDGNFRRFHTLNSLNIDRWSEIDGKKISLLINSYKQYFSKNPYDRWFQTLDMVISGLGKSYYDSNNPACHLDLIPFATIRKWNYLGSNQKTSLLKYMGNFLGLLIRDSPIEMIILNGQSVVDIFQQISMLSLKKELMTSWSLPRHHTNDVLGISYYIKSEVFSGIHLEKQITILGYNHNLQSSFGVTNNVKYKIRDWISIQS
jgi:hypothetical protein